MIRNFSEIAENAWNFFLAQDTSHSFFQTWEWNSLWVKHFAAEKECLIVDDSDCEDKDRALFLPIYIDDSGSAKLLKAVGHNMSDYVNCISAGQISSGEFLKSLRSCLSGFARCIELKHVLRSSMLCDLLLHETSLYHIISEKTEACSLALEDTAAVEKAVEKRRLRDYKRQLVKSGSLRVLHLTEHHEILKYLDAFFALHIKRWENTDTPSYFNDNRYKEFYAELVKSCAERVVLSIMFCDDDIVAMHYGFMYRGLFYYYTPAFNESYLRYRPGQLMVVELIRFAVEKSCKVFDMTVGAENYKKRFTNRVQDVYTIRLYGSKARADIARLYYSVRDFLKRFALIRSLVGVKRKWGLGKKKFENRN
jgi:CelD/BcsL family acetyltransferase involved in cellulose biosynthesis